MLGAGRSRYDGFGRTSHYDSRGNKTGYSSYSGFGKTNHYDSRGNKTGYSYDSGVGKTTHYDASGRKTGTTYNSGFGMSSHYNASGQKIGHSHQTGFGGTSHCGQSHNMSNYQQYRSNMEMINYYENHANKSNTPSYSSETSYGGKSYMSNSQKQKSDLEMIYYYETYGNKKQSSSEGCYIATCVYGSYDCPEVWQLRRFRDFSLRKNVFGRTFIKVYYGISPTVVKYFGKYTWFHKLWKPILNQLCKYLENKGVEDTYYVD